MIDGLPAFVGNCVRAMLRKGGLWVLHGCGMLGIFAIIADMRAICTMAWQRKTRKLRYVYYMW